jgi:hypothetical protein
MRREKLGTANICMAIVYTDGVKIEGREKARRPWVLDQDIADATERVYSKTTVRRLRVRSIGLSLEALMPLGYKISLTRPAKIITYYLSLLYPYQIMSYKS